MQKKKGRQISRFRKSGIIITLFILSSPFASLLTSRLLFRIGPLQAAYILFGFESLFLVDLRRQENHSNKLLHISNLGKGLI